jgi:hypothetical protein
MESGSQRLFSGLEGDFHAALASVLPAFAWNLTADRFWWSAGMFHLHGFAPGDIEPTLAVLLAHQHPDDRDTARQALGRISRDGRPFVFEHRLITRHGQVRTVLLSATARSDAVGPPLMINGTILDVTCARHIPGGEQDTASGIRAELDRLAARTESRNLINQATGVLMERHKIPVDEAYTLLRRASQLAGRKLLPVASELLFTGSLPCATRSGARIPTPSPSRKTADY